MEPNGLDIVNAIQKRKGIRIISIEGNIGAGKSTLITRLKEAGLNFELIVEPSDEWENESNSGGMLKAYYENRDKRACMFQVYAISTRIKKLVDTINSTDKKIIITERSPETDRMCFFEQNVKDGCIDDFESNCYMNMYNLIYSSGLIVPDKYIFLDLSPLECLKRIKERKRKSEMGIEIDYLLALDQRHKSWMSKIPKEKIISINSAQNYRDDNCVLANIQTNIFAYGCA